MTLRTPRRRISPRTKRRYKAIREFFKRALGSSSQPDIKINSSIAVNVTDLKHKILGIESQLTEVSKHCRDLVCLENSFRKGTENFTTDAKHNTINEQREASSGKRTKSIDTKVLYKNTENPYRKSDGNEYATLEYSTSNDKKYIAPPTNIYPEYHNAKATTKFSKKKYKVDDRMEVPYECDPSLRNHKVQSTFDNITPVYSTGSYRSLGPKHDSTRINSAYTKHCLDKKQFKRRENIEHTLVEPNLDEPRPKTHKEYNKRKSESPPRYQEEKRRSIKNKREKTRLDQEFIADIIKKQYKPLKLFGRRDSEISQFSAPVCRDQEFSIHEDIQEGEEMCSCCFDEHNRKMNGRNHDLSDMQSDSRLYSSKRNTRKHRRHDNFNDAASYDLIPVKEKSSPKSRRKFAEDHMMGYNNYYYKEVPPSPRTLRPRLNLKAQYYTEYDDYMVQLKPNRRHTQSRPKRQENIETLESDITSEIIVPSNRKEKQKFQKSIKAHNLAAIQQDISTVSSLHCPTFGNDLNNVTLNLNKTQESDISDRTDKALCEIKDILQCFLQEIKKDATPSASDSKKDVNDKTTQKHSSGLQQNSPINAGVILDSGQSNFINQSPQCGIAPSFMTPFQNPCCYPILPVCPMNCMQNGYTVPSPSFTCHACTTTTKETVCQDCSKKKKTQNEVCTSIKPNETDELIKEIYKFVAQSPKGVCKKIRDDGNKSQRKEVNSPINKEQTSRSVGASSRISKHDAQVGTPTTKCYSKSCEAIGSRMITDSFYSNTTQSDTVLERLSLEITQSDSEISSDSTVLEKKKKGKFTKVLQSIGFLKKKKKDVIIAEISESETSVEEKIKPKLPFRQEVMNYAMHGQEYFHRPPIPPYRRPEGHNGYGPPPGYDPRAYPYSMPPPNEACTHHRVHRQDKIPEHSPSRYQSKRHSYSSAPPYPNYEPHCSHQQPHVPLCLKEIEVKSTGTQSERKMSFFQKLAKRPVTATARSDPIKNCSTQTPQTNNEKTGLFRGWKNLQAQGDANDSRKFLFKNLKGNSNTDPMKFTFDTQKELTQGDMKVRNAMLKKLFYKRNPFSPRNMIVRTILGKDQASYGEPQMSFKPRLFF